MSDPSMNLTLVETLWLRAYPHRFFLDRPRWFWWFAEKFLGEILAFHHKRYRRKLAKSEGE
jgi:hypothetical protein